MNKVYLLFFALIYLTSANAQYPPMFGNTETGWYEYNDVQELGGRSTLSYYTVGDTIVDGKTYWILNYDWVTEQDTLRNNRIGSFREDVAEKKVYQLNSATSIDRENVMYDFSNSPGDTVHLGKNVTFVVDSITNVINLCGEKKDSERKVHYLHNPSSPEPRSQIIWIEGIGNIASFNFIDYSINCSNKKEVLICKMTDSKIDYHNDEVEGFEDCPFEIASSNNNLPEVLEITLYPNPSRDDIYVSGNALELGNALYKVYDLTGKTLLNGKLPLSNKSKISTSHLNSGMYFLEIFNKDQNLLTNKKFIITQ